jgi:hypothetical protein
LQWNMTSMGTEENAVFRKLPIQGNASLGVIFLDT